MRRKNRRLRGITVGNEDEQKATRTNKRQGGRTEDKEEEQNVMRRKNRRLR